MATVHKVKDKGSEIASLVLPTQALPILLPNEAVAEIVTEQIIPMPKQKDDWYLGNATWRTTRLPVVSFERYLGKPMKTPATVSFMAVLNGFKGDERLPFYGLVIAGLPSLERVVANELVTDDGDRKPAEKFHVIISGDKAVIPDLAVLEDAIVQRMSGSPKNTS